jgi:hypothetical protein
MMLVACSLCSLLTFPTRDISRLFAHEQQQLSVTKQCAATPTDDRLSGIVGPMVGRDPVWLVDGSSGWRNSEPVKTLWVLSRQVAGVFQVRGHRLDGNGFAAFKRAVGDASSDALVIPDPLQRSLRPGGASHEMMASYAFIPTYVIYPTSGCWELTAQLGARTVRIVREFSRDPKG